MDDLTYERPLRYIGILKNKQIQAQREFRAYSFSPTIANNNYRHFNSDIVDRGVMYTAKRLLNQTWKAGLWWSWGTLLKVINLLNILINLILWNNNWGTFTSPMMQRFYILPLILTMSYVENIKMLQCLALTWGSLKHHIWQTVGQYDYLARKSSS